MIQILPVKKRNMWNSSPSHNQHGQGSRHGHSVGSVSHTPHVPEPQSQYLLNRWLNLINTTTATQSFKGHALLSQINFKLMNYFNKDKLNTWVLWSTMSLIQSTIWNQHNLNPTLVEENNNLQCPTFIWNLCCSTKTWNSIYTFCDCFFLIIGSCWHKLQVKGAYSGNCDTTLLLLWSLVNLIECYWLGHAFISQNLPTQFLSRQ